MRRDLFMKKLILIAVTGVVLISCVLISTLAAGPASAQNTSEQQIVTEEKAFVIGIENGRVAVFEDGEEKPLIVTETYANNLPKIDRDELEKGVRVSGEKELQKAIEDYCS